MYLSGRCQRSTFVTTKNQKGNLGGFTPMFKNHASAVYVGLKVLQALLWNYEL